MDCGTFERVVERLDGVHDAEPRATEPWEEIVMTILSQNTNDDNRDEAFEALWARHDTPAALLDAEPEAIQELIAPAGLHASKTEYLRNAARHIVEDRAGDTDWIREDPSEDVHDELTSIAGVGHKTADVILLFAADAELCPVDTHVDRVTHRLGVATDMGPGATRERLLDCGDDADVDLRAAHVALIAHGRATCTARSPACDDCAVADVCEQQGVDG